MSALLGGYSAVGEVKMMEKLYIALMLGEQENIEGAAETMVRFVPFNVALPMFLRRMAGNARLLADALDREALKAEEALGEVSNGANAKRYGAGMVVCNMNGIVLTMKGKHEVDDDE